MMPQDRVVHKSLGVVAVVLLLPAAVAGQTGIIAGSVKDTTGAVLPGVTVEATSPALIEKVRTTVTDGAGVYKLVDLRLGVYTVTFTLAGFGSLQREGVQLSAGVTATVNAELRVSAVSETVTVSGQSALVDVQNTTQHRTITRSIMDELPTGRQFANYVATIPGVTATRQDVGGAAITDTTGALVSIHGSSANDMPLIIDGMRYTDVNGGTGAGSATTTQINNGMVDEIAVNSSGATAEYDAGGVVANVILKQGGNAFSVSLFGTFSNEALQSNNFDDTLRASGAGTPSAIQEVWDVTTGVGGPLLRDKLWFYGSYRYYGVNLQPTGAYHAKDPAAVVFERGEPATSRAWNHQGGLRLSAQTSRTSKLSFYGDLSERCLCDRLLSATRAWEATGPYRDAGSPLRLIQGTWNWTATSRFLVEIGQTYKPNGWTFGKQPEIPADRSGVVDAGTGISSRAPTDTRTVDSTQWNGKAILTYVTGSHNFKVGAQWFKGDSLTTNDTPTDSFLNLSNGVPTSVTQRTTPQTTTQALDLNLGIFAQEQYTLKRLTANLGVRWDHAKASIPAQHADAVRYAGPRDFAAIPDVPNWNDITPRVGVSYDLFGNGKTAVKWNLGKYVEGVASGLAAAINPLGVGTTSTTRPWTDRNGDFIPDCDLTNFAVNGECGVIDNNDFAKPGTATIRYDPALITGWGKRGYNWELMAGIQHELYSAVSVDVSYHRRSFGNFRITTNQAVTPADFDEFCVTTPVDPRLPGGGAQLLCGLFNVTPTKFGVVDSVITKASNYGDISHVFDGVDAVVTMRLRGGGVLQGGTSTGRSRANFCDVVIGHPEITSVAPYGVNPATLPRTSPFCDLKPPFLTQVKFAGVYPLPLWNLQTSAVFQSIRYPQELSQLGFGALTLPGIRATRAVPVAEIIPSLMRPLSGGVRTATVDQVPPGELYGERLYQFDLRVARTFRVRNGRIQPQFDFFNLFNSNTVLEVNSTYGPNWQQPLAILLARMVKFSVQVNF